MQTAQFKKILFVKEKQLYLKISVITVIQLLQRNQLCCKSKKQTISKRLFHSNKILYFEQKRKITVVLTLIRFESGIPKLPGCKT